MVKNKMPSQDCHHTITCPLYANWLEHTRNPRTDVIICTGDKDGKPIYGCSPLIDLKDDEAGIPIREELAYELSNPDRFREVVCPLNSLNNPNYLENQVNGLLKLLKK